MKPREWRRGPLGRYLRHLPRHKHVRGTWLHRWLGDSLFDPHLWHPDRQRVAAGLAIGGFFSMLPMPMQSAPAVLLAYFARVNVPAAYVAVWVSNPFTMAPILYAQYRIGLLVLGGAARVKGEVTGGLVDMVCGAPLPILVGACITGLICSVCLYLAALALSGLAARLTRSRRAAPRDLQTD